MKKTILSAAGGVAICLSLAACGEAPEAEADPVSSTAEAGDNALIAALGDIDDLSTARDLIDQAGLETTFDGVGAYTLFLPSDEAFAALPEEDLARLKTEEGRPELIAILRRHIAVGAITRGDLDKALDTNGGSIALASVADTPIAIRKTDEAITLGGGEGAPGLTSRAEAASNGVIYVIDGLIPPEA